MAYEEKPTSRRARIVIIVLVWCVAVPFFIALWMLGRWLALPLLAGAIWATWDYLKRGDMFGPVDRGVGGFGRYLPGGLSRDDRSR